MIAMYHRRRLIHTNDGQQEQEQQTTNDEAPELAPLVPSKEESTKSFSLSLTRWGQRHCWAMLAGVLLSSFWTSTLLNPYWDGRLLWYLRLHLDVVKQPYEQQQPQATCLLTTLDPSGKIKYAANLQQNRKWAESNGWRYFEYFATDYYKNAIPSDFSVMFLKYHGMKYLFDEQNCQVVFYVDADAVPMPSSSASVLPMTTDKDWIFGNEVFVYAMHQVENQNAKGVLNAGLQIVRNSNLAYQFINDLLTHERCRTCRQGTCWDFAAGHDQGCIERLLQHEYSTQHFGVARIQAPVAGHDKFWGYNPGGMLVCHPAGLIKDFYENPCAE